MFPLFWFLSFFSSSWTVLLSLLLFCSVFWISLLLLSSLSVVLFLSFSSSLSSTLSLWDVLTSDLVSVILFEDSVFVVIFVLLFVLVGITSFCVSLYECHGLLLLSSVGSQFLHVVFPDIFCAEGFPKRSRIWWRIKFY